MEGFNFNQMPQIPKELAEQAQEVVAIFNQLKSEQPIAEIEIPIHKETREEYIRKLEIMKKGTIVPIAAEEQERVLQRIDQYIEKLSSAKVIQMGKKEDDEMKLAA